MDFKAASPVAWPYVSLIVLKSSRSMKQRAYRDPPSRAFSSALASLLENTERVTVPVSPSDRPDEVSSRMSAMSASADRPSSYTFLCSSSTDFSSMRAFSI